MSRIFQNPFLFGWGMKRSLVVYPLEPERFSAADVCRSHVYWLPSVYLCQAITTFRLPGAVAKRHRRFAQPICTPNSQERTPTPGLHSSCCWRLGPGARRRSRRNSCKYRAQLLRTPTPGGLLYQAIVTLLAFILYAFPGKPYSSRLSS